MQAKTIRRTQAEKRFNLGFEANGHFYKSKIPSKTRRGQKSDAVWIYRSALMRERLRPHHALMLRMELACLALLSAFCNSFMCVSNWRANVIMLTMASTELTLLLSM